MSKINNSETATKFTSVPYAYKNDMLVKSIMKEASRHSPITREEERELLLEYKNPETSDTRKGVIKAKILNSNMRFVIKYALNYKNIPVHLADIISAARVGVLIAIDLFDIDRNKKFISFAVWYIKSQVSKLLEGDDLIKLPSHQKVKLNKNKKEKSVENFNSEVRELYEVTQPWISYDAPIDPHSDLKLSETIADVNQDDMESIYLRTKIYSSLKEKLQERLNRDELTALVALYGLETGEPQGLREVGDIMKKSHERIRQLRDSAIVKLQKSKEIVLLASSFKNLI